LGYLLPEHDLQEGRGSSWYANMAYVPDYWNTQVLAEGNFRFFQIFKIGLDINAGKWYSHLAKWRLRVTILWGIGRLAANLTLPMPKMMKKPSPHIIYERWLSCFISNIPAFPCFM
jgi:hypothetical protein